MELGLELGDLRIDLVLVMLVAGLPQLATGIVERRRALSGADRGRSELMDQHRSIGASSSESGSIRYTVPGDAAVTPRHGR